MDDRTRKNIEEAIDLGGKPSKVARHFGLSAWGVSKWTRALPPERVIPLCDFIGWEKTPHQLSPVIYPHPEDGLPDDLRQKKAA